MTVSSNSYEITGKVKVIGDVQTFASGFTKREVVLTTADEYPQDVKIEFVKDRCALADKFRVGDAVTVAFNIRGNEYNGKYYVSLNGWKVSATTAAASQRPEIPDQSGVDEATGEDGDNLPF